MGEDNSDGEDEDDEDDEEDTDDDDVNDNSLLFKFCFDFVTFRVFVGGVFVGVPLLLFLLLLLLLL